MSEIVGYATVTNRKMAPLFCKDCAKEVNQEVEPRTDRDLVNFDTASCSLCSKTFYKR